MELSGSLAPGDICFWFLKKYVALRKHARADRLASMRHCPLQTPSFLFVTKAALSCSSSQRDCMHRKEKVGAHAQHMSSHRPAEERVTMQALGQRVHGYAERHGERQVQPGGSSTAGGLHPNQQNPPTKGAHRHRSCPRCCVSIWALKGGMSSASCWASVTALLLRVCVITHQEDWLLRDLLDVTRC